MSERTYRQRPTKWTNLRKWREELLPEWTLLRERALRMVYEGRVSVLAYTYRYNLTTSQEYRYVMTTMLCSLQGADPVAKFDQILSGEFDRAIQTLTVKLSEFRAFLDEQDTLTVAETEGAKYNAFVGLTLEDLSTWEPE